ncbi:MAG TPA: VWA domain-containing protein, partial [bacterium]|nr:VWA domain-containing protein [bacterium]
SRTLHGALAQVAERKLGWHGGTRIGDCLSELVELHGARVLRPDSVIVILSDGLDVGQPERLGGALRRIRERTSKIIWLNPLLGLAGYQPLAGGMQAALPWVDVFAPAHSVDSLLDIGRHLVK